MERDRGREREGKRERESVLRLIICIIIMAIKTS